jgi:hypothetical protein
MRILGFSKHWPKLDTFEFTTFRLPREDKDWHVGEVVQIVIRPRSKDREVLGIATIVSKEVRWGRECPFREPKAITEQEAIEDGFNSLEEMRQWLTAAHGARFRGQINKLVLNSFT